MTVKVIKTKVYDEEVSEIDFDLQNEFGTKEELDSEDGVYIDLEVPKGSYAGTDSYPVKIETLQKMLQDAKDNGATHVEVDYHCDHIGYIVAGFKLERDNTPPPVKKVVSICNFKGCHEPVELDNPQNELWCEHHDKQING